MTTNSQLSTNKPKRKKTMKTKTKQTRPGTDSQKWRSHRGFQWEGGGEERYRE